MPYATEYETPIGKLVLASDGESLTGAWFEGQKYFGGHAGGDLVRDDGLAFFSQAREWLDRYFADDPLPVSALPLNPEGTAFQKRVWRKLREIPYGKLRTYGEIAEELATEEGKAHGSARAVGSANGRNPISIVQPCHRVVGADGSLTGYAGGVERKLWLLRHEHVDVHGLSVPAHGTAL